MIPQDVEGSSYASIFQTGQGTRPSSQLYIYVPVGEPAFGMRGVRTHTHTLVLNKKQAGSMQFTLYDRIHDPYELMNVVDEQPEVVQRLILNELVAWLQKTRDPWLDLGSVCFP